MADNTTHITPDTEDVNDVFDVGSTQPIEPVELDLTDQLDERWQSEAGILASPPAPEPAERSAATPLAEGQLSGKRSLSVGVPSKPLLGRLPLARVVPQDVHSVMDYLDAGGVLAGAFLTSCPKAKAASVALGLSGTFASSITDYKLSLAKVLPIEVHETIDYGWGLSAIAAPFLLGYRKTAPHVAALHVAIGLGTIVASLFTDYRAYRGVGRHAAG